LEEIRIKFELKSLNAEKDNVAGKGVLLKAINYVERFCAEIEADMEDLGCSVGQGRREEFEVVISKVTSNKKTIIDILKNGMDEERLKNASNKVPKLKLDQLNNFSQDTLQLTNYSKANNNNHKSNQKLADKDKKILTNILPVD
jgi:hypothetical protein